MYQSINIQSAAELNESTYVPNGGTALYDAMGLSMKMMKKRIEELPEEERPEKVIFAILTDGEENSSRIVNNEGIRKYTKEKIFEKVSKLQEESNYVFIYLGANQDAMLIGQSMGVYANNTVSYEANTRGMTATMDSVNKFTKSYRKTNLSSQAFAMSADLGEMFEESLDEIDKKEEKKEN